MLTPVDIENKEFKKSMRGYDVVEVEEFLKALVLDYEKLYRENAHYKERNSMLQDTIASYKGMEETMQNAIIVAQKTAEDIKKSAYERSENIVKQAQNRANDAISQADRAIGELEKKYLNMRGEMESFRARMQALLGAHMQLLGDMGDRQSSEPSSFDAQPRYEVSGHVAPTEEPPAAVPQDIPAATAPTNPVVDEILNRSQQERQAVEPPTQQAELDIKKQTFDASDPQDGFSTKEIMVNLSDKDEAEDNETYFDVFKDNSL